MNQPVVPKPKPIFAVENIILAACLLTLHPKELRYDSCRYHFDTDAYHFWFVDKKDAGRELLAQLKLERDPLVPAKAFRVALNRLYRDFRAEQRRVGNPNSLGEALRG